jgi:hypothetical protein
MKPAIAHFIIAALLTLGLTMDARADIGRIGNPNTPRVHAPNKKKDYYLQTWAGKDFSPYLNGHPTRVGNMSNRHVLWNLLPDPDTLPTLGHRGRIAATPAAKETPRQPGTPGLVGVPGLTR